MLGSILQRLKAVETSLSTLSNSVQSLGVDQLLERVQAMENLVAKRVRRTTEYTSTPCLQTSDAGLRPTGRNLVG